MTTPLTQQQLDDIEARAGAATPGPWGFYDGDNYADVAADLAMTSRSSYSYREKIAQLEDENYWDDPAHEDDDESRAPEQMAANAAFIAHAREDVPVLLAEVRRQRADLAAYEMLAPQQCPAGKHADWLVDSEYAHACPWCQIEGARVALSEALHLGNGAPWDAIIDRAGELSRRDVETPRPATAQAEDTLPAWLYSRFNESLDAPAWDCLTDDDRAYWGHQARAVRRAVARGGFRPRAASGAPVAAAHAPTPLAGDAASRPKGPSVSASDAVPVPESPRTPPGASEGPSRPAAPAADETGE